MIPPFFLRSMIFNLLFYFVTGISCVVLLPTLILPRRYFLAVVHYFVYTTEFLEKYILGLSFEIRGLDNLPVTGSYLIAAKHQSAYETTKLHILFDDPAIVLKKELLRIPLWGWYLAKSDVIAIDRSSPKAAVKSIQDGAKRMAAQGRPIVIFPQGTRVLVNTTVEQRPYKIGVVRIQEATGLPIIPMAMNTGVFWPRNSMIKKPGRVIFEFLPAIPPGGNPAETLERIQREVEQSSFILAAEGIKSIPKPSKFANFFTWLIILGLLGWCINWVVASQITKTAAQKFVSNISQNPKFAGSDIKEPQISGFPFKLTLDFPPQKIVYDNQIFEIKSIKAQSWPIWGLPITLATGPITIQAEGWKQAITYDAFGGHFTLKDELLDIADARLIRGKFTGTLLGTILFSNPYPELNLAVNLNAYEGLLIDLVKSEAVEPKAATIAGVTLESLKKEDGVTLRISSQGRNVYLGPLRVYQFPDVETAPAILENGSTSNISTKRQKPIMPAPDQ